MINTGRQDGITKMQAALEAAAKTEIGPYSTRTGKLNPRPTARVISRLAGAVLEEPRTPLAPVVELRRGPQVAHWEREALQGELRQ
jgi:hypothetical protein